MSEDDIIGFLRECIVVFKVLKFVDFIKVLFCNFLGKILKKDLCVFYWDGKEWMVN